MPRTGKTAQAGEIQMAREAELMDLAAKNERERILAMIRAKHGRDFENTIRETIGLPRNY